jgi:putative transposase
MTYQSNFTLPTKLLEQISANGFDQLAELIQVVVNIARQAEHQQYLGAAPYQRTLERQDQANGYKPKTVKTRLGEITFDVPYVRAGGFYPEALEKGLRSERALTMTLAEVSKVVALMDETLEAWRQRPLS